MRKPRRDHSTFNPEKFLAADAKKKLGSSTHEAIVNIRPPMVVLASDYKEQLYVRLRKERPELFAGEAVIGSSPEPMILLVDFLKSSFAKDGLKMGGEIFGMLYLDFVRELASGLAAVNRRMTQKPNKAPEPTTGSVTPRADARVAPAPVVAHL